MFADANRNAAYEAALRKFIHPSSIVVDIGTGSGLFALMAARAGAARVYAIEPDPIVQVARDLAAANGLADRIIFIEASSTETSLAERVDVILSDVRAVLPLAGGSLTSLIDARSRFLKPEGVMIPAADTIVAAIVSAPNAFADAIEAWDERWAIDARPVRAAAAQQVIALTADEIDVLTEPAPWTTIDYLRLESAAAEGTVAWQALRPATAHGVALWFEADLGAGIGYSSAPGSGDRLYGLAFLPWPEPVALETGTGIEVRLRADLVGGAYVWTWKTRIDGAPPRRFMQSTFAGAPLSRARIQRLQSGGSVIG
jgi:protein arginine N-methyltransferase 1